MMGYLYVWYLYRLLTMNYFSYYFSKRVKLAEVKNMISLLVFLMIPIQLAIDTTSCKIKYQEGLFGSSGTIISKPEHLWTPSNQMLVTPTYYGSSVVLSTQMCAIILLQCYWDYLSKSLIRFNFMKNTENLFYMIWAISNLIVFPMLQWFLSQISSDYMWRESIPNLIYGIEIMVLAFVGLNSHLRFENLLRNSTSLENLGPIEYVVRHFQPANVLMNQQLNILLTFALFISSAAHIALYCDGLMGQSPISHKFISDFLICNISTSNILIWFLVVLIIHPNLTIVQGSSIILLSEILSESRDLTDPVNSHGPVSDIESICAPF
ncbi:hypothetical protein J3Q64DRAFT_1871793 [Phycomyces blakesleeanus]|uniref:Uncharacterized protein n=2 Tax=Phycomyces blakesleeanus TaxID=4837 RepID=A0A167N245_PHYB8|nr:hypothetical protein PHYBLDRAFT_61173 [Phycomyces blakesleeanus NRRL 1555(-)]OAD74779.1 hypothetical protein PHYBLDRAFT_61173 [Phycomyces blakesleeanus NRRL 1555(-)]|eukprot:XP_018292819.1 hypothetical protein PHYBLDRAFT_61173 [Phycomyces blakesleeanus NRRL 1555(-)]